MLTLFLSLDIKLVDSCMISGFCYDIDELCALWGYRYQHVQ